MIEAGEALASLLHILAAGQAVIVTRAGSMAELPADARAAIAPDMAELRLGPGSGAGSQGHRSAGMMRAGPIIDDQVGVG